MTNSRAQHVFVFVVARDFGFAPNPFHGFCTLACCKPRIRSAAQIGDWVFGVAGRQLAPPNHCVFGMRVTEAASFDDYWNNPRFEVKRPVRNGSRVTMLGDNIYRRHDCKGGWIQEDSHHSRPDGTPDVSNIEKDTKTNRVLISEDFTYFGSLAPKVPNEVFDAMGYSNMIGHRKFQMSEAEPLLSWFRDTARLAVVPVVGDPFQFRQSSARFSSGTNKIIDEVVEPFATY